MARQFFEGGQAAAPTPLQRLPFAAPNVHASIQMGPSPQLGAPVETGNAALQDAWARGAAPASNGLAEAWNRGASSSQAPVPSELAQARLGMPGMPLGMGMYGESRSLRVPKLVIFNF